MHTRGTDAGANLAQSHRECNGIRGRRQAGDQIGKIELHHSIPARSPASDQFAALASAHVTERLYASFITASGRCARAISSAPQSPRS